MNCRKFLQFGESEMWKPSRLVWDEKAGEALHGDVQADAQPPQAPEADAAQRQQQLEQARAAAATAREAGTAEQQQTGAQAEEVLTQAGVPGQTPTPEQIKAAFAKPEYAEAYQAFLKNPDKLDEFLAKISDAEDKKIIEWAIKNDPTEPEKTALAERLKTAGKELNEGTLAKMLEDGTLDYREGKIAQAMLNDAARLAESPSAPEQKEAGFIDKITSGIQKLIEKITALISALLVKLGLKEPEKKSNAPERKFASSPLGNEAFTIKNYEQGSGATIEAEAGKQLLAAEAGQVKVEDKKVTVTRSDGVKIIYKNIEPKDGINNTTVNAGDEIGTVAAAGSFEFQLFKKEGEELNPTEFLQAFVKTAPPPASPPQPEAQAAGAKPPAQPRQAVENAPDNELSKHRISAINETLRPYWNQTVDFNAPDAKFAINLPVITEKGTEPIYCAVYGNTIEIGAHKYKMELPNGAKLQSAEITEPTNPTETLADGKFVFSDKTEISLQKMIDLFDALQKNQEPTYTTNINAQNATFTKID